MKMVWTVEDKPERWLLGQRYEANRDHTARINGEWVMSVMVYADRVEWVSSDEPDNKLVRGRAKNLRDGKAAAKAAWRRA